MTPLKYVCIFCGGTRTREGMHAVSLNQCLDCFNAENLADRIDVERTRQDDEDMESAFNRWLQHEAARKRGCRRNSFFD